jgi:drug/metabolite transporter (DMT)-like permease
MADARVTIHLKLLIATIVWGATPTIGRVLASFEAPFVVVCGRFLVAGAFLWWFARTARVLTAIQRPHAWRFVVLGASGIWLHNGLMYWGLEHTTATIGSIFVALIAAQIVVLDLVFYRRLPDWPALVGVVLSFAGAAVVITGGDLGQVAALGFGRGELLVFLSALAWAVYSVVGRELLDHYPPLALTTWATGIGLLFLLPFLAFQPAATVAVFTDPAALALIALLGFVGTALGYLWYYQAVQTLGTVGASVYINLVPVFGVLSAAIFLGEDPGPAVLAGGALVFAGLVLVNRPRAFGATRAVAPGSRS